MDAHLKKLQVRVLTGPSACTLLQTCQGSRRTRTTFASLQLCKVLTVSQCSINLGVILRTIRTKQAPVLVRFTAIYIFTDLDQEALHMNKSAVCPALSKDSSVAFKRTSHPPSQRLGIISEALNFDPGIRISVELTHVVNPHKYIPSS